MTIQNPMEQARMRAINAAKELHQAYEKRNVGDSIWERLFWLFNGKFDWEDSPHQYQDAIRCFIKSMTNPELSVKVMESMGQYDYKELITMLSRFDEFCEYIRYERFEAAIDIELLEYHDYSDAQYNVVQWFDNHTRKYEERLEAFHRKYLSIPIHQ